MPEDKTVTTVPGAATEQSATTPPAPAATDPHPGLQWLAEASPDEILKNDRIRGIFGSRLQQERENIRRELSADQDKAARQKAEDDLLNLAKTDPFTFSQTYLSKAEQERIQRETENLKSSTRADFAKVLGRGYAALPEWSSLTAAEQEQLARSVAGKTDDDALVAFNAAALDVIAERRATKKVESFRSTELDKERKAIRDEEAAKRLKGSPRPALARTNGAEPAKFDPSALPDKEYKVWYEKNVLNNIGRR